MGSLAHVTVVPLVGPFHTRWPRYTVVHVRDAVRAFRPDVVALAPLPAGERADPRWQDTEEIALPHTVVPWALRAGVELVDVALAPDDPDDPGDAGAEADLRRYLGQYQDGLARLAQVDAALAPVRELLGGALDQERLRSRLLPAIDAQQELRRRVLGRGPGDGWLEERAALKASRVLASGGRRIAVVAAVDDVPALERALAGHAEVSQPPATPASEEARQRALLDVAMRGEADDVAALLGALADLEQPEARYHEANLLLANDHPAEALERLEELLRLDFQEPYFLPGFALARLGQLYDLAGRRREAERSYRGALALSYAPAAASSAARAGLERPFTLAAEGAS